MLHLITRTTLVLLCLIVYGTSFTQGVASKLSVAFKALEEDPQMLAGIASIYVADAKTGSVVFEKNSSIGLATASTLKVITSVSAYELLGKYFRYKTEFGYTGNINNGVLNGLLYLKPSGDPTLGSWRWAETKEGRVMQRLLAAVKKAGIKTYRGITLNANGWNAESIPDGWMWQDIGNYYGAGPAGLNWRENQYDLSLSSDVNIGGPVSIGATKPFLYDVSLMSEAKAAAKGTGDNAYIYFKPGTNVVRVRGTIPVAEKAFVISGAIPDPAKQFATTLDDTLKWGGIKYNKIELSQLSRIKDNTRQTLLHAETSPPLDSIIYWFNKKSINLYGEALVKTIAFQKTGKGDTDEGVVVIKDFWKRKGLDVRELNMVDGSGLSPLNRVSTRAQVFILQYAQKQPWFNGFYHSLPEYNGMKLKSGTIRGVKGFCGYHKSADGDEYIVSILVNNYNGAAGSIVQKMFKLLDVLK